MSLTQDSTTTRLMASLQSSLTLLTVRAFRSRDEVWGSNVRLLPQALTVGCQGGVIRNFSDPYSSLQALVHRDVVLPIANMPSDLHNAINVTAATTLLGGPHVLLGVIRGPHPEDPGLLVGELLAQGSLAASAGYLCGTWDHTERFAWKELADLGPLNSLCLSEPLAIANFQNAVSRLHTQGLFGGGEAPVLPNSSVLSLACMLTGMVTASLNDGPPIEDPQGSGRELEAGELAWLLPVKTTPPGPDANHPALEIYFDLIVNSLTKHKDSLRVLLGLSDVLAPLVKDLIRHYVSSRPSRDVEGYLLISNSEKFKRATALWQASQAS